MKHLITPVLTLAALGACTDDAATTVDDHSVRVPTYRVFALAAFGPDAAGNSITDRGWVAGYTNVDAETRHAALWRPDRPLLDLDTLGGPNSNVVWPVHNLRGLVTGIAETSSLDPLGEPWSCSAFFPTVTGHVCRGFAWADGAMRAMPTLGGTHSFATGSNNWRLVVGWADNQVRDPSCVAPQLLQFRAVVWSLDGDRLRQLAPYGGDSTSAATAINDRGQIVGISGSCGSAVGRLSAAHAVLWHGDTITDLGNFGVPAWNTAMAINQRGDVVGFANVPAPPPIPYDRFNAHGFVWTPERGIAELAPLDGDVYSQALGLNEWRHAVGQSCSAGFASCRAALWRDGEAIDLNTRIASSDVGALVFAGDVNDLGWITGQAVKPETGELVAFLAIPDLFGAEPSRVTAPVLLSVDARRAVLARLGVPATVELAE
ncbi:MAG: hypothetical protein WKG01_08065 [Kofleriaceae bacterium]